jgi:hypothetical protein
MAMPSDCPHPMGLELTHGLAAWNDSLLAQSIPRLTIDLAQTSAS